jgi:hypothetical protein
MNGAKRRSEENESEAKMAQTTTKTPLVIDVGRMTGQYVYELDPETHQRLLEKYPDRKPMQSVVISFEAPQDLEDRDDSFCRQIAMLLTGLDWDQIEEMGGARISDPVEDEILWESDCGSTDARQRSSSASSDCDTPENRSRSRQRCLRET